MLLDLVVYMKDLWGCAVKYIERTQHYPVKYINSCRPATQTLTSPISWRMGIPTAAAWPLPREFLLLTTSLYGLQANLRVSALLCHVGLPISLVVNTLVAEEIDEQVDWKPHATCKHA
jgi:hypothetical protein